jgi:hypothetical protein
LIGASAGFCIHHDVIGKISENTLASVLRRDLTATNARHSSQSASRKRKRKHQKNWAHYREPHPCPACCRIALRAQFHHRAVGSHGESSRRRGTTKGATVQCLRHGTAKMERGRRWDWRQTPSAPVTGSQGGYKPEFRKPYGERYITIYIVGLASSDRTPQLRASVCHGHRMPGGFGAERQHATRLRPR